MPTARSPPDITRTFLLLFSLTHLGIECMRVTSSSYLEVMRGRLMSGNKILSGRKALSDCFKQR